MASSASVVVQEVMDEINLENNPLEMQNSYSTDGDANEELHRDLLDSPDGEKSTENYENTDTETEDQDLREETEERDTSVTTQNSLDVLSKACENVTVEENETTGEDEYGDDDETHDEQEHCNVEEGENSPNNGMESSFFEDYIGHDDQYPDTPDTMVEQGLRKSGRKRRPRPVSPDVTHRSGGNYKKPRANLYHKASRAKKVPEVPFKCDLCGSPYITDPTRRGNRPKTSTTSASPRHKRDPETGKMLTLCNACGLSFNRSKKSREKTVIDPDAKRMYLEEAYQFATSLAEGLDEQDALRLYCPRYKTFPCGCVQKYILAEGDMDESRQRAQHLLNLLKQSKVLSKQKCYNTDEPLEPQLERKGKRGRNIGLGNGQRKSKEFEDFVLDQRKYLREDLKLCEQGAQRVLNYSNNFLHKKLKTDPAKPLRVERQKGQAVLGKLKTIEELPDEDCCVDKCASMAITHSILLQQWRNRSVSGQAEARRVLAEMLTPSGGARSNCYKFISWVTGCSHSTIGRVNEQMKKTGGDREPPIHGLINWWKENPKPKKVKVKAIAQHSSIVSSTLQVHHLSGTQLQSMPQIGILQAAANSVGISTAALPSSQLSGNPQVITINAAHLSHLNVPGLNLPTGQSATTTRQVILTPTQHTQFQLQQLQQHQQQIQLQTLQLQQQLQQQLQHEQQQQETEQTQPIQIQIPNQVISNHDGTCLTLASSHDFPPGSFTTTLHPVSQVQTVIPTNCITSNLGNVTQVQQSVPLAAETFLTSDTLQILNSGETQTVTPHVVTLQCSNTEETVHQTVPVSMIHTAASLAM